MSKISTEVSKGKTILKALLVIVWWHLAQVSGFICDHLYVTPGIGRIYIFSLSFNWYVQYVVLGPREKVIISNTAYLFQHVHVMSLAFVSEYFFLKLKETYLMSIEQ